MSRRLAYPSANDTLRVRYANGLTLLVRENHFAPVAVLEGMLDTGSLDDPYDRCGLSSVTASLTTRGSGRYDYATVNDAIESVGASFYVSSDSDSVNFGLTSLSEDFDTLMDVLSDALQKPALAEDQFELVKRQKIVSLRERDEDTAAVANLRFYEALYPDHPLGKPVSGYIDSVRAIELDDVARFHAAHYSPVGAVLAVSGDVQAERIAERIGELLGGWSGPSTGRKLTVPKRLEAPIRLDVPMNDKVQSDIVVGWQAVSRSDPDFYPMRVANTILGVFGMMGRLGEVVREQQGLAYYAYSMLDAGRHEGVWSAAAGVNPANVEQAIRSILAECHRMTEEPVSGVELSDSQDYLTGVLPLTLETNDGIVSALLNMEWHGLGMDYLSRYAEFIRAVSAEDVLRVSQRTMQDHSLALVTAGPKV
jgi:zinc protease